MYSEKTIIYLKAYISIKKKRKKKKKPCRHDNVNEVLILPPSFSHLLLCHRVAAVCQAHSDMPALLLSEVLAFALLLVWDSPFLPNFSSSGG